MSGGMSGVERAVYVRRFGEAERILRRHGYGCINPCRVWACRWPWIYRAMEWVLGKRLAYAVVLCYDLLLLMTRADGRRETETFADIVEMARLYILTDCGGSFERFAEWGLIRPRI